MKEAPSRIKNARKMLDIFDLFLGVTIILSLVHQHFILATLIVVPVGLSLYLHRKLRKPTREQKIKMSRLMLNLFHHYRSTLIDSDNELEEVKIKSAYHKSITIQITIGEEYIKVHLGDIDFTMYFDEFNNILRFMNDCDNLMYEDYQKVIRVLEALSQEKS